MSRRKDGDETWFRLIEWTKGQKPAERMAAMILMAEGFEKVDPSHPLGGPDGKKDVLCDKDNISFIVACYFPRGQKSYSEIKNKFIDDSKGVDMNNVEGMIFFTNQEIKLSERKKLKKLLKYDVEIYHLDRVANLLNQPINYGYRHEFLDIEMTMEEYMSYTALQETKLDAILDLVQNLNDKYTQYKDDDSYTDSRSDDEVGAAIDELFNKIWYDRHLNLRYRVEAKGEYCNPEIWEGALKAAKRVEEKYGIENLGPWDDFEWGMMNGKLSALRWFFGDEWDMLDT